MGVLINEMRNAGVLIDTGTLEPDMLELVVARKNGATAVSDGRSPNRRSSSAVTRCSK